MLLKIAKVETTVTMGVVTYIIYFLKAALERIPVVAGKPETSVVVMHP